MNPVAFKVAKIDIRRIIASLELCPGFDDDEKLKLDMLEGETELNELASKLLSENEDDEGLIDALKAQTEARRERKSRIETRIEARKAAIVTLMDCARLTKLMLPEATVSLRTLLPRPKVADEALLPEAFTIIVRKPDTEAIAVAVAKGENIPGVILTNGSASLTIRRK